MAITFRYSRVPRKDGSLRRAPFIPLHLRDQSNKLLNFIALVDSGADTSVIPKNIAVLLGLRESDHEENTGGIGGLVKVKTSRIPFSIIGEHEKHNLNIPVLVLQDPEADVPLLLGRSGFFENFDINFRQNEEKITLKKVESNKRY